jgi:hypothetical protein
LAIRRRHYICAHSDGTIDAKSTLIGPEERFLVREVCPGTYTIQTTHQPFLTPGDEGRAKCLNTLVLKYPILGIIRGSVLGV